MGSEGGGKWMPERGSPEWGINENGALRAKGDT